MDHFFQNEDDRYPFCSVLGRECLGGGGRKLGCLVFKPMVKSDGVDLNIFKLTTVFAWISVFLNDNYDYLGMGNGWVVFQNYSNRPIHLLQWQRQYGLDERFVLKKCWNLVTVICIYYKIMGETEIFLIFSLAENNSAMLVFR